MGRLFTTGFETGVREWNSSYGNLEWTTDYVRTGTRALNMVGGYAAAYWSHAFDASETHLYFRFAIRWDNYAGVSGQAGFLTLYDHNNQAQLIFDFSAGDQVIVVKDGAGTELQTGFLTMEIDAWYMVEIYMHCDASGTVTVKINNTTDFTYSGDTDYRGTTTLRRFQFYGGGQAGVSKGFYLDDLAVNDDAGSYQTTYAGLGGVYYLKPDGEGATTTWTPSSGTVHYEMVDEQVRNTTDWIQAVDTGEIDLFELEDSPSYVNTINLVQVLYSAGVTESGYNLLMDVVRQGTVNYPNGTATVVTLTPTYLMYRGTAYYVQPNGSGAWGTVEIDALQAGVEIA